MLSFLTLTRSLPRGIRTMSSTTRVPLLLSPKDLQSLPRATTKILDCSWHMPSSPRKPLAEFTAGPRVPGATRWDLDEIAESSETMGGPKGLGHMMPTAERFAKACGERGIIPTDHVVLYDSLGVFSSPRGWYTFTAMGHPKVSILDGGLPRQLAELLGDGAETGPPVRPEPAEYPTPKFDKSKIKSYEDIVAISSSSSPSAIILDARSYDRYTGSSPEPRPSLSSGHMPHSLSLPFPSLLLPPSPQREFTTLLPANLLRPIIIAALAGVPPGREPSEEEKTLGEEVWEEVKGGKEVVWTCGSGMTACVGVLAMKVLAEEEGKGVAGLGIYDESWTGYAMRDGSKIIKEEK